MRKCKFHFHSCIGNFPGSHGRSLRPRGSRRAEIVAILLVSSWARLDVQGMAQGYPEAVWICGSYVLLRKDECTLPLVPVGVLWLTSFHVSRLLQGSMLGSSSSNLHVRNSQFTYQNLVLQTLGCDFFLLFSQTFILIWLS